MNIRKALPGDAAAIEELYELAREFMHSHGNPTQWVNGYPSAEDIARDMANSNLYVCEKEGRVEAAFCFFVGEDPFYEKVENGEWLKRGPSGVVHRIAVRERGNGVGAYCVDWCFSKCGDIKIDTHEDNRPMRRMLEKAGFKYCGVVYIDTGEPRVAYQKLAD